MKSADNLFDKHRDEKPTTKQGVEGTLDEKP
jgi:hypothetical protein